jgi:uncharacterized phage-associated protein
VRAGEFPVRPIALVRQGSRDTGGKRPLLERGTAQEANMVKALDAAHYLIHLAAKEEEPEFLTHMRLQKLLYYAQGWCLALHDRPLFTSRIEAWDHGPVVKQVYPKFADFEDRPIPPDKVHGQGRINEQDREHLRFIWRTYRRFSAAKLRQLTHEESPWINARQGHQPQPQKRCQEEITQQVMREHFKEVDGLRKRLATLEAFRDKEIDPSLTVEELEDLIAQNYPLSEKRLAEYAREHKPPQAWYEETSKPF